MVELLCFYVIKTGRSYGEVQYSRAGRYVNRMRQGWCLQNMFSRAHHHHIQTLLWLFIFQRRNTFPANTTRMLPLVLFMYYAGRRQRLHRRSDWSPSFWRHWKATNHVTALTVSPEKWHIDRPSGGKRLSQTVLTTSRCALGLGGKGCL